jgi:hypothetical protein
MGHLAVVEIRIKAVHLARRREKKVQNFSP